MKLFLDTALPKHVEKYYELGLIEGVTTNPKIFTKSGGRFKDYLVTVEELCSFADIPVSVELTGVETLKPEYLVKDAQTLAEIDHNINIKVPLFVNRYGTGIDVIKQLNEMDIETNATCLMSAYQGILCSLAGANYISLFYRRMRDDYKKQGSNKAGTRARMEFTMLREYIDKTADAMNIDAKIIAGSIRAPKDVMKCFHAGADIVTVTPDILEKMVTHPRTESTIKEFEEAWEKFRKGR